MTFDTRIIQSVDKSNFDTVALSVFRFQYQEVEVYRAFCESFGKTPDRVIQVNDIPFLPISFFRTHDVVCKNCQPELEFRSSGTTGSETSRHLVASAKLYENSFTDTFKQSYGDPSEYTILALLPSYLERSNSSLVYMVKYLMEHSASSLSGFYLYNHEDLKSRLELLKNERRKVILFGVAFALLDFADKYSLNFPDLIVIETGGMKGRGEELTRDELHRKLSEKFSTRNIHSEYGMTEMLSQAYFKPGTNFHGGRGLRVLIRDINDPFSFVEDGVAGCINVIDLYNLYSCSFIATDDLGQKFSDESFNVLGRVDNSIMRGCSTMIL